MTPYLACFLLLVIVSPAFAGLRDDAAAHGWAYGCAASAGDFDNPLLAAALARECGLLSSRIGGKMHKVTPQPGVWDFADLDRVADFARAQRQALHIHTLVWPRSDKNPAWLWRLSPSALQDFMRLYIRTVLSRYPEARYVDVVNEPVSFSRNIWERAMGELYLDIAFREARQVSNATLVLNEYGLEWDTDKQDAMLALLDRLKARGVPVDVLGLESHLSAMPDRRNLRQFVRRVHALGLSVIVTELDVQSSDDTFVAEVYRRYLVLLRNIGVQTVQTWGLRDPLTSHMRPLPFDRNLRPKPAYNAMVSVFQNTQ